MSARNGENRPKLRLVTPERGSGLRPRYEVPAGVPDAPAASDSRLVDAILALANVLRPDRALDDAFPEMVDCLRDVMRATYVCVAFADTTKTPLVHLELDAERDVSAAWLIVHAAEGFFTGREPISAYTAVVEDAAARWSCVPLTADNGAHIGVLAVASPRDRSDAHDIRLVVYVARLVGRLLSARDRAVRAESTTQTSERVLSSVAHDLRSPLGLIAMSVAKLLEQVPDTERRHVGRQQLQAIERSAHRMQRLIGDLLDQGSIAAGVLAFRPVHCRPATIVNTVLEDVRARASARGIELSNEVAADLPLIHVDVGRFGQVLMNLVDNALKFTMRGGYVRVQAARTAQSVTFSVRDSGIGIAPENLPRVFDRYWQARPGTSPGAGIGLSICKFIVESSGGHIWIESKVEHGTTIAFSLPTVADPT